MIGAGRSHAFGIRTDGTVACWGFVGDGECDVPKGLGDVQRVAGGHTHAPAVRSDRRLLLWDTDELGQLSIRFGLGPVRQIAVADSNNVLLQAGRPAEAVSELERAAPGAVERHRTQVSQAARLVIGRLIEAYEAQDVDRAGSVSGDRLARARAWLAAMQAMGPA